MAPAWKLAAARKGVLLMIKLDTSDGAKGAVGEAFATHGQHLTLGACVRAIGRPAAIAYPGISSKRCGIVRLSNPRSTSCGTSDAGRNLPSQWEMIPPPPLHLVLSLRGLRRLPTWTRTQAKRAVPHSIDSFSERQPPMTLQKGHAPSMKAPRHLMTPKTSTFSGVHDIWKDGWPSPPP